MSPILSFDVFDTCLVRRVMAPSEVFRQLGRQLAVRLSVKEAADFAENFVAWRMEAYNRARLRSSHEEVTLKETWEQLRPMLGVVPAEWDGLQEELVIESSVLGPVLTNQRRVAECRARGLRIIFISDTELPREFVRDRLVEHGFWQPGDGLYVSSEVRLTKRSGRLFQHVLSVENITADKLRHLGDSPVTDYKAPRRLGIDAELFTETHPEAFELFLLKNQPPGETSWIEFAGNLRWHRLQAERAKPDSAVEVLVREFLGPFLCLWADWILRRAQQDGVKRLFFAARDARLLWSVANRLTKRQGLDLDCRYLYISRQAIFLPSAAGPTPEEMPWLERRKIDLNTLPSVLAKLDLTYDAVAKLWLKTRPGWSLRQVLNTDEEWRAVWSLIQTPVIQEKIIQNIQQRRSAALAYFSKVGLLDEMPCAIVDLGWYLTSQTALNRICRSTRKGMNLGGYYLGLRQGRYGLGEAGPAIALSYQQPGDLVGAVHNAWQHKRITALEHLVGLADHPSVAGYLDGGEVEFQSSERGISNERFNDMESTLLDYVDRTAGALKGGTLDNQTTCSLLSTLLNSFFAEPSLACLTALQEVPVSSDQNNLDEKRLVEPYTWREIARGFLPLSVARWFPKPLERVWPEASWRLSGTAKRVAYRCVRVAKRRGLASGLV